MPNNFTIETPDLNFPIDTLNIKSLYILSQNKKAKLFWPRKDSSVKPRHSETN